MARYINEDEFVEWVKEHWCADCQNDNGLRCRVCWIDDAIDIVEEAPEADVVPRIELDAMRSAANSYKMHYENAKSEVEALEKEIDRLNHILNCYALQYGTVKDQSKTINKVKSEVAIEILSNLKKEAHNKAVHPCGCKIDPYISLKVLDGIIQKYINKYYEEGKKNEN